ERRHCDIEAESSQTLTLAMQRETIDVFLDEQRRRQTEADLATRDDLVARRRPHDLRFTFLARELLAQVATHDHLGGNQIDHLGDVMADARALGAAARTRPP